MPVIGFRKFTGKIPQLPPHLLPENAAADAQYCDFSHGDLSPLNQGLLYKTFAAAVKAIYTEDGINFFTWPIETFAFKSPVAGDTYGRVYYTSTTSPGLRVAQYSTATPSGGPPSTSYLAGVPLPPSAPTLTPIELNTLRDYPSFAITFRAWWALNGVAYDVGAQVGTTVTPLRKFTVPIPAKSGSTPDGVTAVVEITLTDTANNDVVFTMVKDTNGQVISKSDALPGGIELQATFSGSPSAGGTITATLNWGVMETRAYLFTHVNNFAEESGPSDAAIINITYLQDVQVVATAASFTGYNPLNSLKLYRTFGSSANYVNVPFSTISVSGATYTLRDSTWKGSEALDGLRTVDFIPPISSLVGLEYVGNGFFAAWSGTTVYFCSPYQPHSWPYNISFPYNVRGVRALPGGLVVATANGTYFASGTHPSVVTQGMLPVPQAGISQRTMVRLDSIVGFASNDGIVTTDGNQASLNISQQLWTREDWRAAYGSVLNDMTFAFHDGFLVGVSSTTNKGFIVKMDEQPGTLTEFPEQFDAMFYLPVLDTLYYSQGTNVYRFREASTTYTATWKSKVFILPKPMSLGAIYIKSTAPVTVTVWGDGNQIYTVTLSSGYSRLPATGKYVQYQFQFVTAGTVTEISFARNMKELQLV